MKKQLQALSILALSIVTVETNAQSTVWTEDFGSNGTQRTIISYVPTMGGSTFKFAQANGNEDEKKIQNNHLAIVNPNYIWETGFKDASNTWYWWTFPQQDWGGAAPSGVKSPGYSDAISVNDHTTNSIDNGAVLVVNGGTTIAPLYKRSTTLISGKKYKVQFYVYVVQGPTQVSLDIWANDATPIWESNGDIPVHAYGSMGTQAYPLINENSSEFHKWAKKELVFTVPTVSDEAGCTPAGTPVDVNVILRNTNSENDGNDFYIDDITLIADPVEAPNFTLSCPAAPIKISGNVYFNSSSLEAGTGSEAGRNIFDGATHVRLKLKQGPNTWQGYQDYITVPLEADGSYNITLNADELYTNYGYEILIGNLAQYTGFTPTLGNGWSNTAQGTGSNDDGINDGKITSTSPLTASLTDQNFAIYNANAPLPIVLNSFNAKAQGSNVELTWETAKESNNKGFYIERNSNNGTWKQVGFINSIAKAGNSNYNISYTFTDKNVEAGSYLYRLVQVNFDGSSEISDVRKVKLIGSPNISIYPNPANDHFKVVLTNAGNYQIKMIDLYGKVVFNTTIEAKNTNQILNIERNRLSNGTYFLYISNNNNSITEKVIFN